MSPTCCSIPGVARKPQKAKHLTQRRKDKSKERKDKSKERKESGGLSTKDFLLCLLPVPLVSLRYLFAVFCFTA
jgi:hypothetical protein